MKDLFSLRIFFVSFFLYTFFLLQGVSVCLIQNDRVMTGLYVPLQAMPLGHCRVRCPQFVRCIGQSLRANVVRGAMPSLYSAMRIIAAENCCVGCCASVRCSRRQHETSRCSTVQPRRRRRYHLLLLVARTCFRSNIARFAF